MSKVIEYEFIVFRTDEIWKVTVPQKLQKRLESMKFPIAIQCGSEKGLLRRVTSN